jgi:hypothetical protein
VGAQTSRPLTARTRGRPRLDRGRFFVALISALLVPATLPAAVVAQDPPPPPPPVRDTLVADTVPPVAPEDTLPPPPFVRFEGPGVSGAGAGVWRWDRAALLAETALSVADLLERIPGINMVRIGTYLQPEAATVFGGTSDRVQVVRDGFVLDPLNSSAVDLSAIRLAHLAEVVVERRLDLLRIHLRTDEAAARDPYSRVEAALGVPAMNMFRGIFMSPRFVFGPVAAAVERLESDGRQGREPVDIFETWAKWGWTRPDYGVQAELRRYTLNRRPQSPWPLTEEHQELVVRGRLRPFAGLVTEAYFGQAYSEQRAFTAADTAAALRRDSNQFGARAEYVNGVLGMRGAARRRGHAALPSLEAELGASLALGFVELDGELTHLSWREGPAQTGGRVHAGVRLFDGLRLFGEVAAGSRGAPFFTSPAPLPSEDDDEEEPPAPEPPADTVAAYGSLASQRNAVRAGVEIEQRWVRGGVAGVRVDTDSVPAFRLPFDSAFAMLAGGVVTGVEAWGVVPIPRTAFFATGSVVYWASGTSWAYLPARSWRAGLGVDASPLVTGNLHIVGRAEVVHRGQFVAPVIPGVADPYALVEPSTSIAASLQIRIIDVIIFGRYDDLGGRAGPELPGRPPPGARLYYGVKWSFWN